MNSQNAGHRRNVIKAGSEGQASSSPLSLNFRCLSGGDQSARRALGWRGLGPAGLLSPTALWCQACILVRKGAIGSRPLARPSYSAVFPSVRGPNGTSSPHVGAGGSCVPSDWVSVSGLGTSGPEKAGLRGGLEELPYVPGLAFAFVPFVDSVMFDSFLSHTLTTFLHGKGKRKRSHLALAVGA